MVYGTNDNAPLPTLHFQVIATHIVITLHASCHAAWWYVTQSSRKASDERPTVLSRPGGSASSGLESSRRALDSPAHPAGYTCRGKSKAPLHPWLAAGLNSTAQYNQPVAQSQRQGCYRRVWLQSL